MIGMDRRTGKPLHGDSHLAQSVTDILSTPIGSRVMRRDYGSLLFQLVDAPLNAITRLRLFAAVAIALSKWEPRIRLTRVDVGQGNSAGQVDVAIEGHRTDTPDPNSLIRLAIPLRFAAATNVS